MKRIPKAKRVYIDESGINRSFQREYARSLRGEHIKAVKSGRRFDRFNVIGGLCDGKHISVNCYRGTTKSEFFENWFSKSLLKEIPKGSTVIMDNASFHCKKRLRTLTRGKARLLFIPPYSPDLNPLEKSWANLKHFLCKYLSDFDSLDEAVYYYFLFHDFILIDYILKHRHYKYNKCLLTYHIGVWYIRIMKRIQI